jgi:hypothetical protein
LDEKEYSDDVRATCLHLKDTSEYLLIDLYIQCSNNYIITNVDGENPTVIYDKNGTHLYYEYCPDIEYISYAYYYCKGKFVQESRVKKYLIRNKYLEAYAKYMEYIVNPLVLIARLDYVPQWHFFELCHINRHLPKKIVDRIKVLYQVKSINDIKKNLEKAKELMKDIEADLREKYGIDTDKIKNIE